MTTQHIHASLDAKLIRNADRYFTAGLAQIIDEIVQNARRAGARNLGFRLDGTTLVVTDDGRGLSADKAPVLLRLGGSNNTEAVETAENAAGMGFFSMARYGVTVRSHDWQMIAPPGAFNGSEPAELRTGLDHQAGLRLEIPDLRKASDWTKLASAELILEATRYSGLRVSLDGFIAENGVHEPQTFLAREFGGAQVAVREAHGTTIKVARGSQISSAVEINFYGKVITYNGLCEVRETDNVGKMVTRNGSPQIETERFNTRILIDVRDTSCLALQLPERNQVVQNDGLEAILETVREMQREILRRPGVLNGLALTHRLRQDGGADLPLPQRPLYSAIVHEDDYVPPLAISRDGMIAYPDGTTAAPETAITADLSNLYASLLNMPRARDALGTTRILQADEMMAAFGEARLTTIERVSLIVRADDEEHSVELDGTEEDFDEVSHTLKDAEEIVALGSAIVQDLALSLDLARPDGEDQTLVIGLEAFYHSPDEDAWSPKLLVVPQAKGDVLDAMLKGITWFNSDHDYQEQETEAANQFNAIHARVVGCSEDALLGDLDEEIRNLVRRHLGWRRDDRRIFDITVRIDHNENGIEVIKKSLKEVVVPLRRGRRAKAA